MIRTEEEHLEHYGIKRRSGRYPYGSGGNENVRNPDFLTTIEKLRKQGVSDTEIAKSFGMTTTEFRAHKSIVVAQQRQERIIATERMRAHGMSYSEIARRQGRNESSVRADLKPGVKDRADAVQTTAKMLKEQVDQKNYIMVGRGVDAQMGVTKTRLDTAVASLKEQGYEVHNIHAEQLGTGKYTTVKVLAKPGTPLSEVQRNRTEIQFPVGYSHDNGRSFERIQPPISISSRRVGINYGDQGGKEADGVIYIRPGVKDLSLGENRYGQVRIMVDHDHYLKGMAVYKDDLPEGRDIVFNTKKLNTGRKTDAMKPIEPDPELPFGSIIRQVHGPDGKVSSALNIVGSKEGSGVEGGWDTWSRTLSSQILSKQSPDLATTQLNLTYQRRVLELNEINSLTNPTVRKKLLLGFADEADSAAVQLKAANLPRQANRVILPLSTVKPGEVYAPGFKDGERVALIRHPHAGTFEIPQLTVNNRNPEGRRLLGRDAKDAIGIHHSVAQHLSGADFDGDAVLVIPNNRRLIKSRDPLEGLKDFDPMIYKIPKDSPIRRMDDRRKQQEMGNISNLITDMTLHGANTEELARAVRHSMVVIDAQNHELDFKQSEKDNGILQLKHKYQIYEGRKRGGASTLISRAGAKVRIPQREERPARLGGPIDKATGKKVYIDTGKMRPDYQWKTDPITGKRVKVATGRMVPKTQEVRRLSITENAYDLSSGTVMESIYADHSNRLKALANSARKDAITLEGRPKSSSASKVYSKEVKSLNSKLRVARSNAPLEAKAQIIAKAKVAQRRRANPNLSEEEVNKIKDFELNQARAATGAHKTRIDITPKEWEAIQAGAIAKTNLEHILSNTDLDLIKKYAMPKTTTKMTPTALSRAQQMLDAGYTQQDVADHLGIGLTTLRLALENA